MEIVDIAIGLAAVGGFIYLFVIRPYKKRKTASKLRDGRGKNYDSTMK